MTIDDVPVLAEGARGCGFRKPGGLYLIAGKFGATCGKLPLDLHRCPTCGGGIKFSRGWTWIEPFELFKNARCLGGSEDCSLCPLGVSVRPNELNIGQRAGLLWIGAEHYPTPMDFLEEGVERGISRRINRVPKDFVLGVHSVLLAHVHGRASVCESCGGSCAVENDPDGAPGIVSKCPDCKNGATYAPTIFSVFKPKQIQYVCKGDETPEELDALIERGLTPVRVERVGDGVDDSEGDDEQE